MCWLVHPVLHCLLRPGITRDYKTLQRERTCFSLAMAAAENFDQQQFEIKKRKGYEEYICKGHEILSDLKDKGKTRGLANNYIFIENIPQYPQPEFCVSLLKHDTDRDGLRGIWEDKGFKSPSNASLVWWSLAIGHHEITTAATSPMMTNLTNERVQVRADDLEKFATSPAFQESSRLGAYRFTFPLDKVLQTYSKQVQCCCGTEH